MKVSESSERSAAVVAAGKMLPVDFVLSTPWLAWLAPAEQTSCI